MPRVRTFVFTFGEARSADRIARAHRLESINRFVHRLAASEAIRGGAGK